MIEEGSELSPASSRVKLLLVSLNGTFQEPVCNEATMKQSISG